MRPIEAARYWHLVFMSTQVDRVGTLRNCRLSLASEMGILELLIVGGTILAVVAFVKGRSDGYQSGPQHLSRLSTTDELDIGRGMPNHAVVNPATGLPMMGGVDTAGNAYGFDSSRGGSSGSDFGSSSSFGSGSGF